MGCAPPPWSRDELQWDTWAKPTESRQYTVGLYGQAGAQADATIEALPPDMIGQGAVVGDDREVTLLRILVHMIAEAQRHAGHADTVRELIDGAIGLLSEVTNNRRPMRRGGWPTGTR